MYINLMHMQLSKTIIRNLLFLCLISAPVLGQDVGTVGIRAGYSMPNNLVSNLVNPGKGIVFQFNSKYFYQVRGRFSIEYYKYTPSDSVLHTYAIQSSTVQAANLSFSKFNSIDACMGLDYTPFQKSIPELYFGPQLFAGLDNTAYKWVVYDFFNPYTINDERFFIHGGIRFHLGYEKAFGNLTVYSEYTFSKTISENYNIGYTTGNLIINTNYHQFGLGIRF